MPRQQHVAGSERVTSAARAQQAAAPDACDHPGVHFVSVQDQVDTECRMGPWAG